VTTKTRIVRIGNSRGIRVPKLLLDQADLPEEVELRAEPGRLVVTGVARPRADWAAKAQLARERGDDRLLDSGTATRFDELEWRW
jgi:antitoxin MazE